jgi:FMN phosphatase YigB (HAD superfamily)
MIDDREEYCLGATGVGMQAILYSSFDQMKSEMEAILKQDA